MTGFEKLMLIMQVVLNDCFLRLSINDVILSCKQKNCTKKIQPFKNKNLQYLKQIKRKATSIS